MKKPARLVLAALGLFLLVMMLVPEQPDTHAAQTAQGTAFSAGPAGVRALYLLLPQVGLRTEMLRLAHYAKEPADVTLWMLGPQALGRQDRRDLKIFLERGGRLVTTAKNAATLLPVTPDAIPEAALRGNDIVVADGSQLVMDASPMAVVAAPPPAWTLVESSKHEPVVAAWNVGAGLLVSLGTADIAENKQVGKGDNGLFLVRMAERLGQRHVFDEVKTGFGDAHLMSLLARAPYRWGLVQAAVASLVGLAALAIRRFPAGGMRAPLRRRTLDHIDAVAALWQQGRDAGLPLSAILRALRERARARLGPSRDKEPFLAWIGRVRPDLSSHAQTYWLQAQALARQPHPPVDAARQVVADLRQLEQKGTTW